jgi:hypothetical protein
MSTEASRRQLRSQHAAVYDASQAADPHNCRPIERHDPRIALRSPGLYPGAKLGFS